MGSPNSGRSSSLLDDSGDETSRECAPENEFFWNLRYHSEFGDLANWAAPDPVVNLRLGLPPPEGVVLTPERTEEVPEPGVSGLEGGSGEGEGLARAAMPPIRSLRALLLTTMGDTMLPLGLFERPIELARPLVPTPATAMLMAPAPTSRSLTLLTEEEVRDELRTELGPSESKGRLPSRLMIHMSRTSKQRKNGKQGSECIATAYIRNWASKAEKQQCNRSTQCRILPHTLFDKNALNSDR